MMKKKRTVIIAVIVIILCVFAFKHIRLSQSVSPKFLLLSKYSVSPRTHACTYHTCLDIYQCSLENTTQNHISVYIYPEYYLKSDENLVFLPKRSKEFSEVISAIKQSKYYVSDHRNACVFIPNLDLLNLNQIPLFTASRILNSLPRWNNGTNHLIFNMLPKYSGKNYMSPSLSSGIAMIASGNFPHQSYRPTFDISIPVYNPYISPFHGEIDRINSHDLVITQWNLLSKMFSNSVDLSHPNSDKFLLLDNCYSSDEIEPSYVCSYPSRSVVNYADVLSDSDFCLIYRHSNFGQIFLFDAMARNCIPLITDALPLPFAEVLDWKRCSVTIDRRYIPNLRTIIGNFSRDEILSFRRHVRHFYMQYMANMTRIALTTLRIINDRVHASKARSYEKWTNTDSSITSPPLFYPQMSGAHDRFTAVVKLVEPQWDILMNNLRMLSLLPGLHSLIVLWNGHKSASPSGANWPKLSKSLKIIELPLTDNEFNNQLSLTNEISTESVLSVIGDKPLYITNDDLQTGFNVWCEFSDRLVGLSLNKDNKDNLHFESSFSNLTAFTKFSVIFYHKHYGDLFQSHFEMSSQHQILSIPGCSEIAFKYFIIHLSGKPPLQIMTPESHNSQIVQPRRIYSSGSYEQCIKLLSNNLNYYSSVLLETL